MYLTLDQAFKINLFYLRTNMKKSLSILLMLGSVNSYAGDWYDDWLTTSVPITGVANVYQGVASCYVNLPFPLSANIQPTLRSAVFLYHDPYYYGTGYAFFPEDVPAGAQACQAAVPFSHQQEFITGYSTERTPILPFPSSVDIERLGCINSSQRKIIVTTEGSNDSSPNNMKIYGSTSPYFPDTLFYSGAFSENMLITVNATSDIMNFRVKLDNGSSYYTSQSQMNCTSPGGGGPLN